MHEWEYSKYYVGARKIHCHISATPLSTQGTVQITGKVTRVTVRPASSQVRTREYLLQPSRVSTLAPAPRKFTYADS